MVRLDPLIGLPDLMSLGKESRLLSCSLSLVKCVSLSLKPSSKHSYYNWASFSLTLHFQKPSVDLKEKGLLS